MSHRVNHWHEALIDHVTEREWTDEDIAHLSHMIGHSALMSEQGVLAVLEFQQAIDERIEAEKQFDEVFVPGAQQGYGVDEVSRIPEDFLQQRFEGVE